MATAREAIDGATTFFQGFGHNPLCGTCSRLYSRVVVAFRANGPLWATPYCDEHGPAPGERGAAELWEVRLSVLGSRLKARPYRPRRGQTLPEAI